MSKKTTKREAAALDFLRSYVSRIGCGPTMRELAKGIGVADPKWASKLLDGLERKGEILRDRKVRRGIRFGDGERTKLLQVIGTFPTPVLKRFVEENRK